MMTSSEFFSLLFGLLIGYLVCSFIFAYSDFDAKKTEQKMLAGKHLCEPHEGLKSYDAFTFTCNNGVEIKQ